MAGFDLIHQHLGLTRDARALFYVHFMAYSVAERGVTDNPTQDLQLFPNLTFAEVESYAKNSSGCTSTSKAYKFFAEPGYLHNIQGV